MIDIFTIGWSASQNIRALTTTRVGGVSQGVYSGLNLGSHVGDDNELICQNRQILMDELNLPVQPKWLNQTHSSKIAKADQQDGVVDADGSYTTQPDCICAVLTADCLPVFIADKKGSCVGLFHAGWRGLAGGVLVNAVQAMNQYSTDLIAAIGPAISQFSFEVGDEVRQAFLSINPQMTDFFVPSHNPDHFYADLYGLAKIQLHQLGIESVWLPGAACTYKDQQRFYSYRRDGQTGRMASLIWISP